MTLFLQIIFWLCVCAIGWPYLLYPLLLRLLPGRDLALAEDASFEPTITILIAAYNEEAVIERRIANLLSLDYPREKLECLIVSDGSSDRTNELVQAYAGEGITLLARTQRSGKVNALNAAAPQARGEILVLSDANTEFAPDALRRLAAPFQNASIGCVCGKLTFQVRGASNSGEMEGAYWRLESRLKRREGRRGALLGANGGIYALRRELWRTCPPGTIVEDFVIPMRLLQEGWKVFFEERAEAFEEAALSCSDEFVRRVRIGAGDYQALALLFPMLSPSKGFAAFAFFSRKVVRWLGPFFMLGALAINALLLAIPLYRWLFAAQVAGYLVGLAGIHRQRQQRRAPFPARIGGYFLLMNAALFCGFLRWLTGRHSVKWERTPRSSASAYNGNGLVFRTLMMIKALDLWLPAYLRRNRARRKPPTDLVFCVCDHFEPLHDTNRDGALQRLATWQQTYAAIASAAKDAGGNGPKHTFFYPIEQYSPELLQPMESICREHRCEVEVHLHHHDDTAENFLAQLEKGKRDLRSHGFLGSDPQGATAFGFIHGNWALDNSHPEGRKCGVTGELALLKQAGCYADFTMPSAPDRTQTRRVNSLYYARNTGKPKSHDDGVPVRAPGFNGDSTASQRCAPETLLMIQGPLGLNWRWRKWKVLPRIENADLTGHNPPVASRLALWLELGIHVEERPEWLFIKLHTHGAVEKNSRMLLGKPMIDFHRLLAQTVRQQKMRIHYASARELVNIVHAAEAGHSGDAGEYRDFIYSRPPLLNGIV